jgi:hypothetical protein
VRAAKPDAAPAATCMDSQPNCQAGDLIYQKQGAQDQASDLHLPPGTLKTAVACAAARTAPWTQPVPGRRTTLDQAPVAISPDDVGGR